MFVKYSSRRIFSCIYMYFVLPIPAACEVRKAFHVAHYGSNGAPCISCILYTSKRYTQCSCSLINWNKTYIPNAPTMAVSSVLVCSFDFPLSCAVTLCKYYPNNTYLYVTDNA